MTKREIKALVYHEAAIACGTECYDGVVARLGGEITDKDEARLIKAIDEVVDSLNKRGWRLSR